MALETVEGIHTYEELAIFFPVINGVVIPIVSEFTIDGYRINTKSLRYNCFFLNRNCFACGLTGKFFKIQREANQLPDRAHISMYGVDPVIKGKHILFTKDHIIPRSHNGSNSLKNLVTMCHVCNGNKGNTNVGRSPLAIIKFREDRLKNKIDKYEKVLADPNYWNGNKSSEINQKVQKYHQAIAYLEFLTKRREKLTKEVDNVR